ncbi:M14 family metallopeptidase [Ramlibacter algicola]|uniref:M14 family metallopeptidase n=1 Tax=Ramlibacter algicola TaxID=2795217 RepID=A0A934UQR5_9BURK|nr:M14 family metallopeptidase [Ramlibacter algicola]MBK0391913.1 M14 family metallopeptidase [Ramlibacter algicola]
MLDTAFSSTYAEARQKFIAAAQAAGLLVESKLHPERGSQGEDLAMDVARDGDPSASKLLVLSSACHGVEGFCGSGIQVAALRDDAWRQAARDRGVAVLYVHALNPYGFSHLRRTTHENVDLNRNFHDFSQPLPANPGYGELHPLLFPDQWPPDAGNEQQVQAWIARNGQAAFQAAASSGQHEFPRGMYFGGTEATWSNRTLREVLSTHGRRAGRLAWIDFHTGLGPDGVGERIYAGPDEPTQLARARAWWDGGGRTPVTSIYDGSSTSAKLTGMMWSAAPQECPQAQYTGIALEYGTQPLLQVLQALRAEHWLHQHPDAPADVAKQIKQQMRDAFYTDTPEWRARIWQQAREAMLQAVDSLAS